MVVAITLALTTACTTAAASDGVWQRLDPVARAGATALYDPARDRLLIWGGLEPTDHSIVWTLSCSGPEVWTALRPGGPGPVPRESPRLVLDTLRDRLILFGGWDGTAWRTDVWALSLAGRYEWTELTPDHGPMPPSRRSYSAIFDSYRGRLVVHAGRIPERLGLGQDWSLPLQDGSEWSRIETQDDTPIETEQDASIYDPLRDRLVMYGGDLSGGLQGVWELSFAHGDRWRKLSPAGGPPRGRYRMTLALDPAGDRAFFFGGHDGMLLLNDLWSLSLEGEGEWTMLSPAGALPSARSDHSLLFDGVRGRLLSFGGNDASGPRDDVWEFPVAGDPAWRLLAPDPGPSPGLTQHTMILDPLRDRVVVYGGFLNGDAWACDPGVPLRWSPMGAPGTGPGSRYEHGAVLDAARDRMIVFGGTTFGDGDPRDTWALDLEPPGAWQLLGVSGTPPSGRFGASLTMDPAHDRAILFGGQDSRGAQFNETWELSLSGTPTWTQWATFGFGPNPRYLHSAILDPLRDRLLVFGGVSNALGRVNQVWALSLTPPRTWTLLAPQGPPPSPRFSHSATHDAAGDRMLVFGGITSPGPANDLWALSLAGVPTWTQLNPGGGPPAARASAASSFDAARRRWLLHGGGSPARWGELWSLSLDAVLDAGGAPETAARHGLHAPFPDPARGRVSFSFTLPAAGPVRLVVFDLAGREVRGVVSGSFAAGPARAEWDGRDGSGQAAAPGLYVVRLEAAGANSQRKFVLLP